MKTAHIINNKLEVTLSALLLMAAASTLTLRAAHADESISAGPIGVAADVAGNIYMADQRAHVVRRIDAFGQSVVVAGTPGNFGAGDGLGAAASFNAPAALAVDARGYLYVADADNHTIRRVSPSGQVTTLAGRAGVSGAQDGACAAATFSNPHGVAVDDEGNVFVADTDNSVIRRISPDCRVSTFAGQPGVAGSDDGHGAKASFRWPQDLATDRAGNVYVSDIGSHTIRRITPDGQVSTLAGQASVAGSADGTGKRALFRHPKGIATDAAGNVFVIDSNNYAIRRVTPRGEVITVAAQMDLQGMTLPNGVAIRGTALHVSLYDGGMWVQDGARFVSAELPAERVAVVTE